MARLGSRCVFYWGLCCATAVMAADELPPSPRLVIDANGNFADALPPAPDDIQPTAAEAYAAPYEATPLPAPPPAVPAAAPKPAAPPKKPAPPVFPGAKTLPPTGPYKTLFFENDFSYLKDPKHDYVFGEELKNRVFEIADQPLTISTGGEIRHRFMNEDNRLRPGGPAQTDYNLWRWRHYVDAKYSVFRLYFEGINADRFGGANVPNQQIDVNRWDVLNLFLDIALLEDDLGTHTLRVGRQELLFGRQRLVSPLDWANTRRTFEGARYMIKGDDYRFDAFLVQPVNSATGYRSVATFDNAFDHPNSNVWFGGTYFTYSGVKNTVVDAYWLMLDTTKVSDPSKPDGLRHTLGTRLSHLMPITDDCGKEVRVWDFDTEGGFQFGDDNGTNVIAGFYTGIVGHTWKQMPWTPRFSGLFYYGSGDRMAGTGHNNTFDVLFPLNHAYWAISDNLSGQNLLDYSVQVDVRPTKKLALTSAVHWFDLASSGDKLYNVAGVPVGTPGHGRDVGQALDLYGYYAFNPNFDVQVGYSWFWYGSYVNAVAPRGDATQFYVQTSLRY